MIEPILRGVPIMAAQEIYINIDKFAELNKSNLLKDVYKILVKIAALLSLLRWIKTYEDNN